MKQRTIHRLALKLLRGEMIPLFAPKAINRAIDTEAERVLAERRLRVKRHRSTGTYYGDWETFGLSRGGYR